MLRHFLSKRISSRMRLLRERFKEMAAILTAYLVFGTFISPALGSFVARDGHGGHVIRVDSDLFGTTAVSDSQPGRGRSVASLTSPRSPRQLPPQPAGGFGSETGSDPPDPPVQEYELKDRTHQWLDQNQYRIHNVTVDEGLRYFWGRVSKPNSTLRDAYNHQIRQRQNHTYNDLHCPSGEYLDRYGRCLPLLGDNIAQNAQEKQKALTIHAVHKHVKHGVQWVDKHFPGFEKWIFVIGVGLIVSIVLLSPCCAHNYLRLCGSCIHGTMACCKFCFRPPMERGTAQEMSSLRKSEV